MGCTSFFFKTLPYGSSSSLKSGSVSFFLEMILPKFFAENPFSLWASIISLGVKSDLIPFSKPLLLVRVIVFLSFLQVFGYSSKIFFRFGLKLGVVCIPFCDRNNMKVSVPGQRNNFVDQGVRDFLPNVNWA